MGTAYRLALPAEMHGIHDVFHASLLKPYHGTLCQPPSPVIVDGQEEYVVERIVGHRISRGRPVYLVRWSGYDESSDTWL